jgi:FdhD protein
MRLQEDTLAVEAPLQFRVGSTSLSVTMRTPGHDFELAAGFLLAEDIISEVSQIRGMTRDRPDIVDIDLSPDAVIARPKSQREFMMTSARGVCGKESLESLATNHCPVLPQNGFQMEASVIHRLPHELRRRQDLFESTGGLQAAALFDAQGELDSLREDVGRHNAVENWSATHCSGFARPCTIPQCW